MSTWNLGISDVSAETHALRNKLSSKDGQIAAQQDRLVRQAAEIEELTNALNEAFHKLNSETERALQLETDVKERSDDLRNEKMALQNLQAALTAAHGKVKDNDLESRNLQATLEAISHTSDEHKDRGDRLEREKAMLDARVKELESELREVPQHLQTPAPNKRGISNGVSRPRSSSLSNFKVTNLEQDLVEARTSLTTKDAELRAVRQKFSQVQSDLIKVDNEKLSMERKLKAEVEELKAVLEEKEEDLAYMTEQQGDTAREEQLLKRIDEDNAKIEVLEMMLGGVEDSKQLKEKLQRVEDKVATLEQDLFEARTSLATKDTELRTVCQKLYQVQNDFIKVDNERLALELQAVLEEKEEKEEDLAQLEEQEDAEREDVVVYIERLLAAIDRLRAERDSLRRDVQFLESESRFTIEALEAKLSASISSAGEQTVTTVSQLKTEMDELHSHLAEISERNASIVEAKNLEIKRLGLAVQTLTIALDHSSSQASSESRLLLLAQDELQARRNDVMEKERRLQDVENQLNTTMLDHKAMTSQRDDLLAELQRKNSQWEKDLEAARTAEQETREELEDVLHRMSEIAAHLQDIESERDSLSLQITNLMTDMQNIQEELTNAENRYTSLQFYQLSNMTNNEATRNLRGQIEELENRVMRRTEQIGIHQHDIKRLETNLRLQEERLGEMTTELEMMAAQKDAMVEDCADARAARNEALVRVELLEEELENLESLNIDNTVVVESLIATIAQTVCQAREAIRLTREEVVEARDTCAQQSTAIQQLQEKETALHKSIQEYQNEIQELTTTLSHCQIEAKQVSALDQQTIQEVRSSNLELEERLETATHKLTELERLREQYNDLKKEHTKQQSRLQEELTSVSQSYRDLQCSCDDLQDKNVRLTEDLSCIQKEHATELDRFRDENRAVKQELEQQVSSLQGKFEEQARLLDISKTEVTRIRDRLQEEVEGRVEDEKQHAIMLLSEKERNEDADETILQLRGKLETLERDLQQTNVHFQSAEAEKLTLQQQMTELEAEIQRSKSLTHYLEIQIKDSDQMVATLKGDIEHVKADLAHSEKSWKAAEVNLSLQNAQHKREMTELQRELSTFRSRPNLEAALAELEERNSEMEELLRNKCAEIEENDDRALEMLKEKKKLMTKVESLTRKLQNLQAKLAAAKAVQPESRPTPPAPSPHPTPQSTSVPIPRPRSVTVSSAPPVVETASTSKTRNPSSRAVSGPSFLPRAKTPERRIVTPVFKARTPERHMQPEVAPAPVIGKKRAAPDEFEACENLPAQAFTADGEDIENRTPRVRRVLNNLQSGFTPVRSRPTAAMPSPRREVLRSSPFISDLTNSPAKPSKRSWLGKIRHVTDRPL